MSAYVQPFLQPCMNSEDVLRHSLEEVTRDPVEAIQFYVPVLSDVLHRITERNDEIPVSSQQVTIFHALKAPEIKVRDYLNRLGQFSHCSPECFVLALIYLDRILHRNPGFVISSLNIHRLLVTSVMLAAKFFDDAFYNNAYYARVGGVSNYEMNVLELEFLYLTNFSLNVTPAEFRRYQIELCVQALSIERTPMWYQNEPVLAKFMQFLEVAPPSPCVVSPMSCDRSAPHFMSGEDIDRSGSADSAMSWGNHEELDDRIYHDETPTIAYDSQDYDMAVDGQEFSDSFVNHTKPYHQQKGPCYGYYSTSSFDVEPAIPVLVD